MFKLNFATPDKKVISDADLEEITLPAFAGELNILPGHSPIMTTLEAGILSFRLKNGETKKFAVSWGYCQVSSEGVNVLAESAVLAEEIEINVVKTHLRQQEEKLTVDSLDDAEWEKTQHEVARLKAEIELFEQGTTH